MDESSANKLAAEVAAKRIKNEELNVLIDKTVVTVRSKLKDQLMNMQLLSSKLLHAKDELASLKQHLLLPGCIHQTRIMEFSERLISVDATNPATLW